MSKNNKKEKGREKEEKSQTGEIRAIINGISDLLFVMDKNRVITEVNKSACDTFKKRPEELIGKHCYEIVHGTDCPWPDCPATETLKTKQSITKEIANPHLGLPLLVTTSPILDEQGQVSHVIHIAKDITPIKLAEMELHIAANLFDAASDSIIVHDFEGKLIYFNEAAYKTRGYTKDEFQELSIRDLEDPNNPRFFGSRMNELLNKGETTFEAVNLLKDKTTLPVEVHARVIEFDDQKMVLSVARDISERKKVEEKLKESSRRIELMNEKLRVVGGLTRHDIRNKLTGLNGYLYLVKKKHTDAAYVVERLNNIEQISKEIAKILDFAKMYEQLGVEELSYVDVEQTVNEAVSLFSGLTLKITSECHGLTVLADSFLRQMFYNFIDNTIKYGKKTTTIRLYYEKTESGNLQLIYEDDGIGISTDDKVKLFKECFSTGGSTGFGLVLLKKMVDVYGWQIQETGEPGKGAKFEMSIPAVNPNRKKNYRIIP
jgi:PAS domain S-box-containing protein